MKALLILVLLTGCSPEIMRGISEGFRNAGAAGSEDVYRAQNGLEQSSRLDYTCNMDCTKRYSWAYCKRACSY